MKALSITVPKRVGLLSILILLYFVTSSADTLSIRILIFTAKAGLVVSCCLFALFFAQYRVYLDRKLLIAGILIFLSMVISSFFSPFYLRSAGYLIVYWIVFLFYFILPYNLLYHLDEKHVFKLYLVSFWVVGAHALAQVLFSFVGIRIPHVGQLIYGIARPGAFTYESSYYALYMTAFASFWNSMYLLSSSFSKKTVRRNMLLGNFLLILSTSTGVIFGYVFFFFAAIVFYFFIKKRNYIWSFSRKIKLVSVSFFSFFIALFLIFRDFMREYFFKFFYIGLQHHSFQNRWEGIVNAWEIFLKYPIFGIGYGGIGPYVYIRDSYTTSDISIIPLAAFVVSDPTNVFTEILASQGLLGVLLFSFLTYVFIDAFRKVLRLPDEYRAEKEIANSLFLSLITLILVLQFNPGLFRNYIWVHSAITIAYLRKLHGRAKKEINDSRGSLQNQ